MNRPTPTDKQLAAFYKAHDDSLECQPREHHQAVVEGLSAALEVEAGTDHRDLVNQIEALLDLDARKALTPHGIGGLARELLTRCVSALTTSPASSAVEGEAVAWRAKLSHGYAHTSNARQADEWRKETEVEPLYAHPAPTPAGEWRPPEPMSILSDADIMEAAQGWRGYDAPEDCNVIVYGACRAVLNAYFDRLASPSPQTEDRA